MPRDSLVREVKVWRDGVIMKYNRLRLPAGKSAKVAATVVNMTGLRQVPSEEFFYIL